MRTRYKVMLAVIGTVSLLAAGSLFLRFQLPPVVVPAEPLPGVAPFGFQVTNALLTALLVNVILVLLAFLGTRRMQMVPSGLQNFLEWIVESLYNLTETVAGKRWAPRFFAIVATIFFYVLLSNWFGLVPGLAAVGFCETHEPTGHARQPVALGQPGNAGASRLASPLLEDEAAP
ncbi:MAG: F0F1 ATP synthase subunit A, partial [Ardenticatenia bacterium]|nr:F0F1 ATP synthase subunit A [Ardenticatenia bacterium]